MIQKFTWYVTSDGRGFITEEEAQKWEKILEQRIELNNAFTNDVDKEYYLHHLGFYTNIL